MIFEAAECPSLFPLPRDISNSSGRLPTHVRKFSNSQYPWQKEKQRGDYFQVGDYVAGAPNTTDTWRPSPGFEPAFVTTLMDAGPLYASKDFQTEDGRPVMYGWITAGPSSILSVPRELLWPEVGPLFCSNHSRSCRDCDVVRRSRFSIGKAGKQSLLRRSIGRPRVEAAVMRSGNRSGSEYSLLFHRRQKESGWRSKPSGCGRTCLSIFL